MGKDRQTRSPLSSGPQASSAGLSIILKHLLPMSLRKHARPPGAPSPLSPGASAAPSPSPPLIFPGKKTRRTAFSAKFIFLSSGPSSHFSLSGIGHCSHSGPHTLPLGGPALPLGGPTPPQTCGATTFLPLLPKATAAQSPGQDTARHQGRIIPSPRILSLSPGRYLNVRSRE